LLPLGKSPKLLIAIALLVAALLFLDLIAVRNSAARLLISNSLDFFIVLLAALASLHAARRSQGYARQLWTLLCIALSLETLAEAITTYYQSYVPGSSQLPMPSDILFFVWAAPVFMMFLPAADEKSRGWDWLRILDFAQIAIVAITAYLYFFYSPSRWLANSADIPRQILILYIVRDALISLGFFFRSRNSASPGLRSFSLGLSVVFLLALISDADYLLTLQNAPGAVSWGDFVFLLPYLCVISLAVTWPHRGQDSIAEPVSRFGDLAVTHGFPIVIPLLVLFMGRNVARDQFTVAWFAICATFLCSAVRLILTNRKQRRATGALRESEERFRSFVENLHVGIVSSSPIGEILYANPAALNLFDFRLEQVTGKMLIDLNLEPLREDGSVLPDSEGLIPTVVASRRPIHNLVVGWRHLHSHITIWTLLDAVPQFNSSGEVTNILVSLTDLSEQRRATEALRESEERFRTLVRDLHVGVILAGPDGAFEFANQAALNMFNVASEQVIGRTADELDVVPVDDRGRDIPYSDRPVPTVLRTKRPLRQATLGYRIPGASEIVWIFGNAVPQFNPDGSILRVIASFTDITDLKNAERSIHQLSTELLKLQDEERRRIGRELHDGMAQTVLAVNLSLAQLRQSAQPLNPASHRALEKARELLQQMSREIRTLSYLLHPPLLDDLGLVSALKEYVNGFSERSGIETSLDLLSGFRRLPQIAETAFFRITQESLANIQRHSGSRRAKVVLSEDPDCVTLEITDFGSGMTVPTNGAPHRGQPRLGVGIPGMRERMAQLGGSLEIDSTAGGTTVRARILFSAPVLKDSLYDASLHPDRR
jgi:PAS domain S-box-containing protein